MDTRTILNIEAGRGNPKYDKLYPLITYLKIPADKIFYPANANQQPNLQKLLTLLSMQIDNPERGFSFKVDGPLDLRLNQTQGISAAERLYVINGKDIG